MSWRSTGRCCRSLDKASGAGFITMVSAWSTANGVVLGQVGTDVGSNEIAAIPRLLELLLLKTCLVTIDAAGCQTEIATKITDAGGDYLLSVRDNQPKLHAAVQAQFKAEVPEDPRMDISIALAVDPSPGASLLLGRVATGTLPRRASPAGRLARDHRSICPFAGPEDHATRATHAMTTQTCRGRKETRECWVRPIPDTFPEAARWSRLAKIMRFDSERTVDGKVTRGTRWFSSSRKTLTAKQALAAVRGHWQIENKLHWSLDVAFRENDSRLRAENAAENFAVVRRIALNLLRDTASKVGIKNRRLKAGWSDDFLTQVLVSFADRN